MMMKRHVLRIKRFSIHDGPGIRTAVFLKGCAMRCAWCHTPEGFSVKPEVWHDRSSCIACGRCVDSCTEEALSSDIRNHSVNINRKACNACGKCVPVCPTGAMQFTSKEMTVDEIIDEIEKDRIYYQVSGGGVTLTGGDPYFQPDFTSLILKACRERKIHTAVETSVPMPWDFLSDKDNIDNVDLFLFDLKIFDPVKHMLYTGLSNEDILRNFRMLASAGKNIIVRIPLVKNITDTPGNIDAITRFVHSVNPEIPIEKIPYNPLARNNYERLGIPFGLDEISA